MVPDELVTALVAESARKSRVCWVAWGEHPSRLVWHAWYDGALVVLSGDEQPLPGIEAAGSVAVVMRSKDTGGRLVTWTASVAPVIPGTEQWDEHATALLGVRLNLADPAATAEEWRADATIARLVPVDATAER